uniref:Uncharacterized protein n=1 Tax=Glossina brevipalpis TaxID=37001 RepID=A0A1A9W4Y1_9MUSC
MNINNNKNNIEDNVVDEDRKYLKLLLLNLCLFEEEASRDCREKQCFEQSVFSVQWIFHQQLELLFTRNVTIFFNDNKAAMEANRKLSLRDLESMD